MNRVILNVIMAPTLFRLIRPFLLLVSPFPVKFRSKIRKTVRRNGRVVLSPFVTVLFRRRFKTCVPLFFRRRSLAVAFFFRRMNPVLTFPLTRFVFTTLLVMTFLVTLLSKLVFRGQFTLRWRLVFAKPTVGLVFKIITSRRKTALLSTTRAYLRVDGETGRCIISKTR